MSTPSGKQPAAPVPLPPNLPPEVMAFLQEVEYMEPDRLQVGDRVPSLALTDLTTSETVRIGASQQTRPTALIFGSYT